jgi:hypothetical protein
MIVNNHIFLDGAIEWTTAWARGLIRQQPG